MDPLDSEDEVGERPCFGELDFLDGDELFDGSTHEENKAIMRRGPRPRERSSALLEGETEGMVRAMYRWAGVMRKRGRVQALAFD